MLPWKRPLPHPEFERESKELLAAVRAELANGSAIGKALQDRSIWSGSWKRAGRHKRKLAEPDWLSVKCVWCEQRRDLSREIDVEHYRPKAEVSEWQGDPPPVTDTPPSQVSCGDGYWWLAFAWDNYSFACKPCNQHWKRNLFPVRGPRPPCVEGVERLEQPLLLDPASSFSPRDHFRWDILSGTITGVSDEGRATIITCGLNRSGLRRLRSKAALKTQAGIREFLEAWRRGGKARAAEALRNVEELTSKSEEFTSMRRWIVEQDAGMTWEEFARLTARS